MKKSKPYTGIALGLVFLTCLIVFWWCSKDRNGETFHEAPGVSNAVSQDNNHIAGPRPLDHPGVGATERKDNPPDAAFLQNNADVHEPSGTLSPVLPNDRIDMARAREVNDTRSPYDRMNHAGKSISTREITRYDNFKDHAQDTLPLLSAQEPDDDDTRDFQNIQPPPGELWIRIKPEYSFSTKEIMDRTAAIYKARTGFKEPSVVLWVGGRPWKRIDYLQEDGT